MSAEVHSLRNVCAVDLLREAMQAFEKAGVERLKAARMIGDAVIERIIETQDEGGGVEDAVAWAASQTKLSRTRIQQFRSISEHWDLVGGCNSISAALKMIKPKSKSKPMKAPEKKSAKPMADDPLPEALAGDGFDVLFSKLSDLLLQAVECAKPAERIRLNGLLKLHITE